MSTYDDKLKIAARHGEQRNRIQQAVRMRAYYRERQEKRREEMKGAGTKGFLSVSGKPHPEVLALRLAEVPEDTRSITARLMGDPLTGRSALDRRRG